MTSRKKYNEQPDLFQSLVISAGKIIWWIISLPFRGFKNGGRGHRLSVQDKNYIATKRIEIESILKSENEIELRHAVLEADKLVDYTMKAQGYGGATFADRLRNAETHISHNLNDAVWSGHKVRNQIAHENGIRISFTELRDAAIKLLRYTKEGV